MFDRNILYQFTRYSSNEKTGDIPVTVTSSISCPDSCPFKGAGCYAELGPLSWHWKKVTSGERANSLEYLCGEIKALPDGQLWRHNQAGDLPGKGERIAADALSKLVEANIGKRGFTYTHKPFTRADNLKAIRDANNRGFTINLSANSPAHADKAADTGLPTVTVLPSDAAKVTFTPKGRKIVTCPAQNSDRVTCKTCGLCQKQDRDYIIGFRAHGSRKRKATNIARG